MIKGCSPPQVSEIKERKYPDDTMNLQITASHPVSDRCGHTFTDPLHNLQ